MGRTVRHWILIQTNRPAREKVSVSVALIGIRKRQRLTNQGPFSICEPAVGKH
jgi:hypothetical protein